QTYSVFTRAAYCLQHSYMICCLSWIITLFFFNDPPPTEIYTLSLHDALPIYAAITRAPDRGQALAIRLAPVAVSPQSTCRAGHRSEEHTSELQSPCNLVCRLLLEKKKKKQL